MAPELIIGAVALGVTLVVQAAGLLVWGAGLSHRVKALEDDVKPLADLLKQVTRLETRMEGILEQLKDLNASIRWMRDPANEAHAFPRPRRTP